MKRILKRLFISQHLNSIYIFVFLCTVICISEFILKGQIDFITKGNMESVLFKTSIISIISAGMTYVIISGGIDFSIGSVFVLSNILLVLSMNSGISGTFEIILIIISALLSGALVGFVNGITIVKGKISPYIVTLVMFVIIDGIGNGIIGTNGLNMQGEIPLSFSLFENLSFLGIPFSFICTLSVILISQFILKNMRIGRYFIAMGSNEEATKLSGINTDFYKIITYVFCGFLAGFAGIIQTSGKNFPVSDIDTGFILYVIFAVIIGGTRFRGGKGTFIGTLLGSAIVSVLLNGLELLYLTNEVRQIIIGIVLIGIILWDKFRK